MKVVVEQIEARVQVLQLVACDEHLVIGSSESLLVRLLIVTTVIELLVVVVVVLATSLFRQKSDKCAQMRLLWVLLNWCTGEYELLLCGRGHIAANRKRTQFAIGVEASLSCLLGVTSVRAPSGVIGVAILVCAC